MQIHGEKSVKKYAKDVPEGGVVRWDGVLWFRVSFDGISTPNHINYTDSIQRTAFPVLLSRVSDGKLNGIGASTAVEHLSEARLVVPASPGEAAS